MNLAVVLAIGVGTAWIVAMLGPKPPPAVLAPGQATALPPDQAAQLAQAAQASAALQALQNTGGLAPGFQGATVSGVLVWRGERTPEGHAIVRDALNHPHIVVG